MRKIKSFFSFLLILLLVLLLLRNIIVKTVVGQLTKASTGLTLSMQSLNVGLVQSTVSIAYLNLSNPEGFPELAMLNMPIVYVDYDIGDLFKGKLHLRHLKIYLSDFFVVKDANGRLNLDALKLAKGKKEEAPTEKKAAKPLSLKIDILDLKIGKVVYKDYSKGPEPEVREFNVDINERYKNITDINSFGKLLLVRALTNTTIAELAGFDIGVLKDGVSDVLKNVSKLTTDVAVDAIEASNKTATKAADTIETTVKKTMDKIKDVLPFSSEKK